MALPAETSVAKNWFRGNKVRLIQVPEIHVRENEVHDIQSVIIDYKVHDIQSAMIDYKVCDIQAHDNKVRDLLRSVIFESVKLNSTKCRVEFSVNLYKCCDGNKV